MALFDSLNSGRPKKRFSLFDVNQLNGEPPPIENTNITEIAQTPKNVINPEVASPEVNTQEDSQPRKKEGWGSKVMSYLLPIIAGAAGAAANDEGWGYGAIAGGLGGYMGRKQAKEAQAQAEAQALSEKQKSDLEERRYQEKMDFQRRGLVPSDLRTWEYFREHPSEIEPYSKLRQSISPINPLALTQFQYKQERDIAGDIKQTQKEFQTNLKDLSKRMEDIVSEDKTVENLEKRIGFDLDNYNVDTGEAVGFDGRKMKVDLPGFNFPLAGRVTAHSSQAQIIEGLFSTIYNKVIKAQSGSAVSGPEFQRLREQFQTGAFNTEEQKLYAIQLYKQAVREAKANTFAGYDPEVVNTYNQRFQSQRGQDKSISSAPPYKPIYKESPQTSARTPSAGLGVPPQEDIAAELKRRGLI